MKQSNEFADILPDNNLANKFTAVKTRFLNVPFPTTGCSMKQTSVNSDQTEFSESQKDEIIKSPKITHLIRRFELPQLVTPALNIEKTRVEENGKFECSKNTTISRMFNGGLLTFLIK